MKNKTQKHSLLKEAEDIGRRLKARWPEIITEASLETQEGEDAYIWIKAPQSQEDEIRLEASGLTVELYENKRLYIVPRMIILDSSGQIPKSGP